MSRMNAISPVSYTHLDVYKRQALMGVSYFRQMLGSFPRHLLTVVSCAAIVAVTVLGMQRKQRTRLLSAAITVLLTAVIAAWTVLSGRTL